MKNHILNIVTIVFLFGSGMNCSAQSPKIEKQSTENQQQKNKEKPNKVNMENITAIMVALEIDGKNSLFVLLAKDGSINRLGTGTEDNTENSMYIGITKPETFEKLFKQIDSKVLDWEGEYKSPDIKGKTCELTIGFKLSDGTETGSVWFYGTQSQGPPTEIKSLVVSVVEATEPWYEEQKQIKKP